MPDAEGERPAEAIPPPLPEGIEDPRDLCKLWKDRITASGKAREDLEEDWERWTDEASGKWEKAGGEDDDEVFVNKPFAIVRSIKDQTYSRNPRYKVLPKRPQSEKYAEDLTHLLANVVEDIGLKREAKRAVHQATIIGPSWLKTWWKSDVQMHAVQESALVKDETGVPVMGEYGVPQYQQQTRQIPIDHGKPIVRQVDAEDVRWNLDATRLEDITFIAHRVTRPTESVKKDKKFQNAYSHIEDLKPSCTISASDHDRFGKVVYKSVSTAESGYDPKDGDRNDLWEIEDLENAIVITIAEGHDYPLLIKPDEYRRLFGPLGMWTSLVGEEDPKSPNGIGVMAIIEPAAEEQNKIQTRSLQHTAWAIPKVVYSAAQFVDRTQVEEFASGDSGAMADVLDVDKAAKAVDFPNLPIENDKAYARLNAQMDEHSGSSGQQRGIAAAGVDTATQAAILAGNEKIAVGARVDRVEDAMKDVGRKLLKLCRTYMTTEQVVRILGPDGSVSWRQMTPADIEGEYDVDVEYGSTVQRDDAEEKQTALNLYNLAVKDPIFNPIKVRKDLLRALGKGGEIDEYINPQIAMAVQVALQQMGVAPDGGGGGPQVPIPGVPSAPGPSNMAGKALVGPQGNGVQPPTLAGIRAAALGNENQPKV